MNPQTQLQVRLFDVEHEDGATDLGYLQIRFWCHDRNSLAVLLRIEDYPATFYVALPLHLDGLPHIWNTDDCLKIHGYVSWLSGQRGQMPPLPYGNHFSYSKFLYYYGPPKPVMLFAFKTKKSMWEAKRMLSKPINVRNLGREIKLEVLETEIDVSHKLMVKANLKYAGWLECVGTEVVGHEKISSSRGEYIVKWSTLKPTKESICFNWYTYPTFLSFDIETFSDTPGQDPHSWNINHVCSMISCTFFKPMGKRIRYGIILGYCHSLPKGRFDDCEIIRISEEVEYLSVFDKLFKKHDPDIITGWNILKYDLMYLKYRFQIHNAVWPCLGRLLGKGSAITSDEWESKAFGYSNNYMLYAPGRITIDLFEQVRRNMKLESYRLGYVSKKILANEDTKDDVTPEQMYAAYGRMIASMKKCSMHVDMNFITDLTSSGQLEQATSYLQEAHTRMSLAQSGKYKPVGDSECSVTSADGTDILNIPNDCADSFDEITRIMAYCIQDSELVANILETIHLWPGHVEAASINDVTIKDLLLRGQQIRGEHALYRECASSQIIMNKVVQPNIKFSGGSVQKPVPGFADRVLSFDFQGLYPSILIGHNLCYTTLIHPSQYDSVNEDEVETIVINDTDCPAVDSDSDTSEDDDDVESVKGPKPKPLGEKLVIKFMRKPEGVLPKILRRLCESRAETRKALKSEKDPMMKIVLDNRQLQLKISANSIYGFTGTGANGKRPCMEVAVATTAYGRKMIQQVIDIITLGYDGPQTERCSDMIYEVLKAGFAGTLIYGDTDSCMISFKDLSLEECFKYGKRISDAISCIFPMPITLEFEGIRAMLCVKKKMYAYFNYLEKTCEYELEPNGVVPKLVTKGLLSARRDSSAWSKTFYNEILRATMLRAPLRDVLNYINDMFEYMCFGNVSHTELYVTRQLGYSYNDENYFLAVFSKKLRKCGKEPVPGDRIKYLVVANGEKLLGNKLELYDDWCTSNADDKLPIDYMYYMNLLSKHIDNIVSNGYKEELKDYNGMSSRRTSRCHNVTLETPAKMVCLTLALKGNVDMIRDYMASGDAVFD